MISKILKKPSHLFTDESTPARQMASYLNLKTNRWAVLKVLKKMGDYNKYGPQIDGPYSFWAACRFGDGEDEKNGYVIYGVAGVARYLVDKNGRIAFSPMHSPHKTEKARSLGFEIEG